MYGRSRKPAVLWVLCWALWALLPGCAKSIVGAGLPAPAPVRGTAAYGYLAAVQDRFNHTLDVYTDADAAGNHFLARGRFSSKGDEEMVREMDERFTGTPHSGLTCIHARFSSLGYNWGGWYLMNGVLAGDERAPGLNWGQFPDAGLDLHGASELTFWARGKQGGERVEFMVLGVGWKPETGERTQPHPDSSPKASTGYVTLSKDWTEYTIDLRGKDLSYVLGGFGWATSAAENGGRVGDIEFYLDDIQYHKERLDEHRMLLSYETIASQNKFDVVLRNVAFTYDAAVALLAFLAVGDGPRAKLLADALAYALRHDRAYADGTMRNAYQAGDLVLPPGWKPHGMAGVVRMPGWYESRELPWTEDKFAVSTDTGNVAWAILALLGYYERFGGDQYLAAVKDMGEWVERQCRDARGEGGYTGGVEPATPPECPPASAATVGPMALTYKTYKATEHNIDLYAAFQRLYLITCDPVWQERAKHARDFVEAMWDDAEGKFWTGTKIDGVTKNTEVVPVDIQAWALLALREERQHFWSSLDYAAAHHAVRDGFAFYQGDRRGVWPEGSAQMAVAYRVTGQRDKAQRILDFLHTELLQDRASGGVWSSDIDGLRTGFDWVYYRRLHVGATAWLVLAEQGINPFWPSPPMRRCSPL